MQRPIQLVAIAALAVMAAACTTAESPSADPTPTDAPSASATAGATAESSASPEASETAAAGAELEVELDDTAAGEALTAPDGLTLYIFLNDEQGGDTSACTADCAANWPAFIAEEGQVAVGGDGVDGEFGTITRENGTRQVTYEGWPLYYYAGDAAPGDANGDGVGGVWIVAPASGEAPS